MPRKKQTGWLDVGKREKRLKKHKSTSTGDFKSRTKNAARFVAALQSPNLPAQYSQLTPRLGRPTLVDNVLARISPGALSPSNRDRLLIHQLKDETDSGILAKVLAKALTHAVGLRNLVGDPFPARCEKVQHDLPIPATSNLFNEIRWQTYVLVNFAAQLNNFLLLKSSFEDAFLAGNLELARTTLYQVKKSFGFSLWLIESTLLLAEHMGGLKENRQYSSDFQDTIADPLTRLVVSLYSARSEHALTRDYFDSLIAEIAETTDPAGLVFSYLRYKLHFFSRHDYSSKHLPRFLHLNSNYTIIDRYLGLVKTLLLTASTPAFRTKHFTLSPLVAILSHSIRDPRLILIGRSLGGGFHAVDYSQFNDAFDLITSYTRGHYEDVLVHSATSIQKNPSHFLYYELFVKSLLMLGRDLPVLSAPNTLSTQILTHIYHVAARDEYTSDAINSALGLATSLQTFSIGALLFSFIIVESGQASSFDVEQLRAITAPCPTPRDALAYHSTNDARRFLNSFRPASHVAPTLDLFVTSIDYPNADVHPGAFPLDRVLKYQAIALERQGNYDAAIERFESLLTNSLHLLPIRAFVTRHLYDCYIAVGALSKCADFAVDAFLSRPNFLLGVRLSRLLDPYMNAGSSRRQITISWVIVYYLVHEHDQPSERARGMFRMFATFLTFCNVNRPTMLPVPTDSREKARLIYFWRFVCTLAVMDSWLAFPTKEDLEEERLAICQKLIEHDSQQSGIYRGEISTIIQSRTIRKAVHRVEEGKIYVDTEGLCRSLDKSFRDRFLRLHEVHHISEKLRRVVVLLQAKGERVVTIELRDMAVEAFKGLFYDLSDRFHSSPEFGLDSYLSGRIRHGTFAGQIRSGFEGSHLITRKSAANSPYAPNVFWHPHFDDATPESIQAIDDCFRSFSAAIDRIIEKATSKWIQIRSDNEKNEGLFDYSFSDNDLKRMYQDLAGLPDFDKFIAGLLSALWTRTRENLLKVRDVVRGDLRDILTKELDRLESDLRERLFGFSKSGLSQAIIQCRTDVQNILETIAAWFNVSDEKSIPDYDFDLAVNVTRAIASKVHPLHWPMPSMMNECQIKCKGSTLRPFVEIMTNLVDNIIQHADACDPRGEIRSMFSKNELRICASNRIREDVDLSVLRREAQDLQGRIRPATIGKAVQREGKSGYFKLRRLLDVDLGANAATISIDVNDNRIFSVAISLGTKGIVT